MTKNTQQEKYVPFGEIAIINSIPLFFPEYFKKEFWDEIFGCQSTQ